MQRFSQYYPDGQPERRTAIPRSESIPCNLKSLRNPEYFRHISICSKPECRDRYRNHLDVMHAYRVPLSPELERLRVQG